MDAIFNYDWPGNIRELKNALHSYSTVRHMDFLDRKVAFDNKNRDTEDITDEIHMQNGETDYHQTVMEFEKKLILKALNQTNWQRTKTVEVLGIPRRTLYNKMKLFGLI